MSTKSEGLEHARLTLGLRQKQVLHALRSMKYATNTLIAHFIHMPINSITPRCHELRKKNLVVYSHTSWCPVTKRKAKYWKINEKGVKLNGI